MKKPAVYYLPVAASLAGMALLMAGIALNKLGVTGVTALEYCEALRDAWIRQPANSWSNLAFIAVGWAIALGRPGSGPFFRGPFYPVSFAMLAVFLGVGSFAFHASTTVFGWYLDAGSMFLFSSYMLAYALVRLWKLGTTAFAGFFVLGLAVSVYFNGAGLMFPGRIDGGSMIFGLLLVLASIVETYLIRFRRTAIDGRWALAFMATFALSIFIWSKSRTGGPWCDPGSLLQGHAVWHILDAACVWFIYRFYRSEKAPAAQ